MTTSLAVCASRGGFACALRTGDRIEPSRPDAPRDLVATVAELCEGHGCSPHDLDEVRLDLGPGSYTGLRVAVTFARSLLEFAGVRVLVATSMELIALHAWSALEVPRDATVRPILDARRGRLHSAPVRWSDTGVELAEAPRAVPLATLVTAIDPGEVLVVEHSVEDEIRALGTVGPVHGLTAGAADLCLGLFDPGLRARAATAAELEPLYLMGSYAD